MIGKRLQRIHYREFLATCDSAASTTLSATKPNFAIKSSIGAEAPKLRFLDRVDGKRADGVDAQAFDIALGIRRRTRTQKRGSSGGSHRNQASPAMRDIPGRND
jgi:hypothetical protein